jgi:hypothetical protein
MTYEHIPVMLKEMKDDILDSEAVIRYTDGQLSHVEDLVFADENDILYEGHPYLVAPIAETFDWGKRYLTWRSLLSSIEFMTPEEREVDVTFFDTETGEFYSMFLDMNDDGSIFLNVENAVLI